MKVLEEWPFVYTLPQERKSSNCHYCFKQKPNLEMCQQCCFAHYCDTNCKNLALQDHRIECELLGEISPVVPSENARLIARLIFKKQENLHAAPENDKSGRKFEELTSHSKEDSEERSEEISDLCKELKTYLGSKIKWSTEEAMDIFGKLETHDFYIRDWDLSPIGTGLYLNMSIMNHSCDPDCVVFFQGPKAIVHIINAGIDPNTPLKDLTISYIDCLPPTIDRQSRLLKEWGFECQCIVCMDKEKDSLKTGFVCLKDDCNGISVIIDNELVCKKCGFATEKDASKMEEANCLMNSFRLEIGNLESVLYQLDDLDLDKCTEIYGTCITYGFHKLNVYRAELACMLSRMLIQEKQYAEAEKFMIEYVECLKKFYPENHPMIYTQMIRLCTLLVKLDKGQEAKAIYNQAGPILKNFDCVKLPTIEELSSKDDLA